MHAWAEGGTTHTLCGCGDPALFLWFFQWPATALAHGQNPFFSTALFHPEGINLLAQTSVTGMSLPLVPVTWIWGPVASLNVAVHAGTRPDGLHGVHRHPALGDLDPGRLRGRPPLRLLAVRAHEPGVRASHDGGTHGAAAHPHRAGRDRRPPAPQRSLDRRAPGPAGLRAVLPLHRAAGHRRDRRRARPRRAARRRAPGRSGRGPTGAPVTPQRVSASVSVSAPSCSPGLSGSRSAGPAHLSGVIWPNIAPIGGYVPANFVAPHYIQGSNVFLLLGGYSGNAVGVLGLPGVGIPCRSRRWSGGVPAGPASVVLRVRPGVLRALLPRANATDSGGRWLVHSATCRSWRT